MMHNDKMQLNVDDRLAKILEREASKKGLTPSAFVDDFLRSNLPPGKLSERPQDV